MVLYSALNGYGDRWEKNFSNTQWTTWQIWRWMGCFQQPMIFICECSFVIQCIVRIHDTMQNNNMNIEWYPSDKLKWSIPIQISMSIATCLWLGNQAIWTYHSIHHTDPIKFHLVYIKPMALVYMYIEHFNHVWSHIFICFSEAVRYCFMSLIRRHLDIFRDLWNKHSIRTSKSNPVSGRPFLLYKHCKFACSFLLHFSNSVHYLCQCCHTNGIHHSVYRTHIVVSELCHHLQWEDKH